MDKLNHLGELYRAWSNCRGCHLAEGRRNVVFGYGNPNAQVMIIGEAPGENEDLSGLPFVGKAGMLLDQYLASTTSRQEVLDLHTNLNSIKQQNASAENQRNELRIQMREALAEEFYFANVVMCRPPDNRDPMPEEIAACRPRLLEQIYTIDPLLIITAGAVATSVLVGKKVAITAARGELFDIDLPGRTMPLRYSVMAVLHPAYLARINDFRQKGGETHKTYKDFLRAMYLIDEFNKRHFGIQPSPLRPKAEKD